MDQASVHIRVTNDAHYRVAAGTVTVGETWRLHAREPLTIAFDSIDYPNVGLAEASDDDLLDELRRRLLR